MLLNQKKITPFNFHRLRLAFCQEKMEKLVTNFNSLSLTVSLPPAEDDIESVRLDSSGLSLLIHNLYLGRDWYQISRIKRSTLRVRVL